MNKDVIIVLNIVFFFFLVFIVFPFFVLYKKIVFPSWIPNVLLFFAVALEYLATKLEKDERNKQICSVLDNVLFFIIIPSFLWTGISLVL